MAMAPLTLRLMVLFSSDSTFTLWVDVVTCGLAMLENGKNIRGLVFFDPGTREGT